MHALSPLIPPRSSTPVAVLIIPVRRARKQFPSSSCLNITAFFFLMIAPVVAIANCTFTISPSSGTYPGGALGTTAIPLTVSGSCYWFVTSDSAWLGVSPYTFALSENTSGSTRTGTITARDGIGNVLGTYTVTQTACTFTMSPSSGTYPGGELYQTAIPLTGGCYWSATSDSAWLTVVFTQSFVLSENTSGSTRTGTITARDSSGNVVGTYTVTQTACTFTMSPSSGTYPGGALGRTTIPLTGGCYWSATSDSAWLTVIYSYSFALSENTSGSTRTGTITARDSSGNVVGTYTVTQASLTSLLTVVASPPNGGTVTPGGTFPVGSSQTISATAASNLAGNPPSHWQFVGWNDGNTDNPRTVTVPAGGATYTAQFSPMAVITFYHQPEDTNGGIGHVFLRTTTKSGESSYYGFVSTTLDFLNPHPGHIQAGNPGWDFAIAYPVSDTAYYAAGRVIEYHKAYPPNYFIRPGQGSFDCVDWAVTVASVAGIQLPPYINLVNVSDPLPFGRYLKNTLGPGGVYRPGGGFPEGVVIENPSSSLAEAPLAAVAQPPYDFSYSAIEIGGHANAANLTTFTGLAYDSVNLGTVNANSINGLSLNLAGVNANSAIISMSWGDGTAFEAQSLTFSHIYSAGTYAAHLLVVDSGAVHSYNMTVVVSSSPGASVGVNVAPFPPLNTPNPGLLPADPVPDFIVLQTTSISTLANGHALVQFFGVPGWTYTIQATSDLKQGFLPVASKTAAADGTFQYDDPTAVNAESRFYRATFP